jgi:hypothetical protein
MTAVLAVLERLLSILLSVFGLTAAIQQQTQKVAQEHSPFLIEGIVTTAGLSIANPTYGLAALHDELVAIAASIAGLNAPVLAAIAALPAGSDIVIPTPAQNATGVWAEVIEAGVPTATAGELLDQAGTWAEVISQYARFPIQEDPHFSAGNIGTPAREAFNFGAYFEGADWSTLLTYPTLLAFLEDQLGYVGDWQQNGAGEYYLDGVQYAGRNGPRVWCTLPESAFTALKMRTAAPVWPGLANVTLGAPVALGSDVTVAGPLDGLLIAVTTPPSGLGKFQMGGFTSYYSIGQVSFITDNGEAEPWQYIGFDVSLYCPRQQGRAASAILRVLAGAGGTATPWLAT